MNDVSLIPLVGMFLLTVAATVTYLKVALTNPGYIKGNKDDVDKRAGAYDPKHY